MRKPIVVLWAVGLLAFLPPPARAWNSAGHMTVALHAYRQLSDGQKVKIAHVLEKHPHFDLYLAKDLPPGVDRNEWVFIRAATWPDFVRSGPPEIKVFSHPEWHFIDQPVVPTADQGAIDAAALKPKEPHAVSQLKECVTKLTAADTSDTDRAVYLCWLLHLVGDVHQPLHATKLFSSQFPPPEGDRGGNFFFVPNSLHAPNLHHYWDELLGADERFQAVDLTTADLLHSSRFQRAALQKDLSRKAFEDWAEESHQTAVELAYQGGNLRGVNNTADHHHGSVHVPPLTVEYERNAREVAHRRGALAGHRLADQLKEIFPGP
jgi:hypothetical protein